ncbi:MAG: DAK2 domain-containing protein [Planctomycetaceae bacterium]|nr:DAK2 domain-containing protein [Planctomycetaceae bacterium]
MLIDKIVLTRMVTRIAALWRAHMDELTNIDSRFGDGDHGVTIGKIADVLDRNAAEWDDDDIAAFLAGLAEAIMAVPGGSAAPLYGTFFEGFAEAAPPGVAGIDASVLKAMMSSALDNLQTITKAKIGDKTMMDTIIPAVQAVTSTAEDSTEVILTKAAEAAEAGAAATAGFVAKYGRARSYGDATLGTPDVGALSAAMMFRGLSEGLSA